MIMIYPSEITKKWPHRPLSEVVDFLDSKRKPITQKDRVPGPYPYYGANGQQDSVADYIFDEPLVLLAEDGGHFGDADKTIAYQVEGKCWVNNHAHVLRPKKDVDIRYICRHLERYDVTPFITGSTRGKLTKTAANNIPIALPPLEEQRRIAAILDKADGVRRKRKEAIRLTEELLRSTFLEMFGDPVTNPKGWEVKRLGEICTNFQNGIGKNSEHYGHGSKVANISDLYEWHRFIPEKYSLLDVTPKEIEKYSLMRGDLLFVRSSVKREGVAVCSVYDSDEICLFSSFMIRVRPRTDLINPEFLSLMLRTPPMRNRLILGSNTSTITNISQPGLSKIEVVVPPIKTQNLITKVTKNIEESVRCHLQALEQSENLFNSLLQRAFRGEL